MFVVDTVSMRAMDAGAIEAGTPSLTLMERAGMGAVRAILRRDGWLLGHTLVVCGKGNNGGDGLVVARLLAGEGHQVRVLLAARIEDLSTDATTNLHRARRHGVDIVEAAEDPAEALRELDQECPGRLVVDALLGTGFAPPLRPELAELVGEMSDLGRRIIALDTPSGLGGDRVAACDLTLSLGFPKWALLLPPTRALCGRIENIDLEFPWDVVRDVVADASNIALYVERTLAAGWWRPRAIDAHKYNAGSVLVVGASAAMSGAVALACNAAYRAGAGLVEAIVPRAQAAAVDTLCVESLVHLVAETASGGLSDAALAVFEARARPADAMLLGPGGGEDLESARVFLDLIDAAAMPLVVDADALRAFVRLEVEPSFTQPAVLTPHDGELVSLLGITRDELSTQRRELILGCARRWNAIILHKGAPTMVAAPDGSLAVIGAGGPGLATAGSGDVLAGAVAALLAAGMPPLEAACLAAYLHGRAGDRLEEERGVAGLMARDLVDELARVVAEVEGDLR